MGQGPEGRVVEDAPGYIIHDEKLGADDGFVLTQQPHARHRHIGVGQRRHDAVLPLYFVCAGQ